VREFWSDCVQRAEHLAAEGGPSARMLAFYARVLALQQEIDSTLGAAGVLTGALSTDCSLLRPHFHHLLRIARDHGPEALGAEAADVADATERDRDGLLLEFWRDRSDRQFFPKTILQPYARLLAGRHALRDVPPPDRNTRCPHCGGRPQLSVIQRADEALAHGGGRSLLCANCLTPWRFNRLMCASCGEHDERRLKYFHAPEYDHLRVDACDACHRYSKAVDLTRLGLAAPLVDEAAGAALDVWAREHGYEKIELNLLGL
jgi:formate dehydrogenase accessory protein FdhE